MCSWVTYAAIWYRRALRRYDVRVIVDEVDGQYPDLPVGSCCLGLIWQLSIEKVYFPHHLSRSFQATSGHGQGRGPDEDSSADEVDGVRCDAWWESWEWWEW